MRQTRTRGAQLLSCALFLCITGCVGADQGIGDVRFEIRGLRLEAEDGEYSVTYRHRATIVAFGDSIASRQPYLLVIRVNRLEGGNPETADDYPTEGIWPVLDGAGDLLIYGGYRSKDDPAWAPEKLELTIVGAVRMAPVPGTSFRTP